MKNLIEALQIFLKYSDSAYPTCCEHDVLYVLVPHESVSDDDKKRLSELGFEPDRAGNFRSYVFGSA